MARWSYETEEAIHRLKDGEVDRWETTALIACMGKGEFCPGGKEMAFNMALILLAALGMNVVNGQQRRTHLGDDAQIDAQGNVVSRFYYDWEDFGPRVVCTEADLNRALAWVIKECDADDALYNVIQGKVRAWFSRDERNISEHADLMRETALR